MFLPKQSLKCATLATTCVTKRQQYESLHGRKTQLQNMSLYPLYFNILVSTYQGLTFTPTNKKNG